MLPAPFDILPRSPCSLPFFGTRSFHTIFTAPFSSLFAPCSSFIFPLTSCSISQFFAAPCSLFQIFVLPAARLRFPCSLLPSLFLGHDPDFKLTISLL